MELCQKGLVIFHKIRACTLCKSWNKVYIFIFSTAWHGRKGGRFKGKFYTYTTIYTAFSPIKYNFLQ